LCSLLTLDVALCRRARARRVLGAAFAFFMQQHASSGSVSSRFMQIFPQLPKAHVLCEIGLNAIMLVKILRGGCLKYAKSVQKNEYT
jgi:hypothetical protein